MNWVPGGGFDEFQLSERERISELEDVAASLGAMHEFFVDKLCQIIFEGEDTEIGRKITIDRIKEFINYERWLTYSEED